MAERSDEKAVNDIDNGIGSCDVCHGNHYVDKSPLQTAPRLYSNCPICVVQNATTTDIGPVTNSNDRGQLRQ